MVGISKRWTLVGRVLFPTLLRQSWQGQITIGKFVAVLLMVSGVAFGGCKRSAAAPAPEPSAPAPNPSSSIPPLPGRTPIPAASAARERPNLLDVRGGVLAGSGFPFVELRVDLRTTKLSIAAKPGGGSLDELAPPKALAVINGGYFEADYRPTTWLRDRGVDIRRKSRMKKGGVLAVHGDKAWLGPFAALDFEPEFAMHNSPLLIERDASIGIHSDDGRRAARTAVCLSPSGLRFVLVFAEPGSGPTLFEFAKLLASSEAPNFGCKVALNLDGGPSTGVWFAPHVNAKSIAARAPIAYGIAIEPKQ